MIERILASLFATAALLRLFPTGVDSPLPSYGQLPQASVRIAEGGWIPTGFFWEQNVLPEAASVGPSKKDPFSLGIKTEAGSAMVVDALSGKILFEKGSSIPRSIGSITKLLTALVFLETPGHPALSASAAVEAADVRLGGRQHLPVRETVTVQDLLHASLVSSDNSSTVSLARLSGLSEADFVARMNEKAAEIGMQDASFADPVGLSPDNRATAPDVVRLLRAVLENETIRAATELVHAEIVAPSGKIYPLENTDELLESFLNEPPYRVVGGKTGYLPEAGYCLGVQVQENGDHDLFVVALGSDSKAGRVQDVKALSVWAYRTFEWP
ncbi:MAG TPA: serine hydrolase [Patescibacteria group bacterium]|nr:serine hydrolase [Patescibacteria group bacterium]